MADVLSGGLLILSVPGSPPCTTRSKPRRANARSRLPRAAQRTRPGAIPGTAVQPGQLASPFLKFGFPSLLLH